LKDKIVWKDEDLLGISSSGGNQRTLPQRQEYQGEKSA